MGLNPFFIRSSYQTMKLEILKREMNVLIPFSSGHLIKLWFYFRKGGWVVLIPFSSGHLIKQLLRELNEMKLEVLIPFSSGHLIKPNYRWIPYSI